MVQGLCSNNFSVLLGVDQLIKGDGPGYLISLMFLLELANFGFNKSGINESLACLGLFITYVGPCTQGNGKTRVPWFRQAS